MKRFRLARALVVAVFASFGLSVVSPTAHADVDALDGVPGASLLFPYFEVDLASATGRDTMISWRNVAATAILTHVTVWTDLGMPVLTFNVYLTGYDVTSFDLRDVLVNGNLPLSASAGQDPSDTISPKGSFSQDINFASCNGQIPYPDGQLNATFRSDLQAALTGGPATFLAGMCSGFNHHDQIARGYITVDTVNNCTTRMPGDNGYFNNDITDQSEMVGEYFLVDAGNALMHQDAAVALESDPSDSRLTTLGNYTFYGRSDPIAWNANDNREPLPNTWAVDAQAAGSELIVWRDVKVPPSTFACTQAFPTGFPLSQQSAFAFDNQENPTPIFSGTPFGLATQRVTVPGFPLAAKPGWVYLGLSYTSPVGSANAPSDTAADQAYVAVLQYPESHVTSTTSDAIALDSGQAAQHTHPSP